MPCERPLDLQNRVQTTRAGTEAQSADLVAGNIDQLKALFPDLITEGSNGKAVNVDVLKALVGDQTVVCADENPRLFAADLQGVQPGVAL